MNSTKEHILFIINPLSGGKDKQKIPGTIASFFRDKPAFTYQIVFTAHKNHATEIVEANRHRNFTIMVAVGGDGTINEVGKALLNSGIALGIIPLGSGNGFAFSLGYEKRKDIRYYLHIICQKKVIKIDTGQLNRQTFLNIAGAGFDAFIARKFERLKGRGLINYARLTLFSFFRFHTFSLRSAQKEFDNVLFVSFSNGTQFGNHFVIAPQSSMQDSKIEISIVRKPRIWEIPAFITALRRNHFPATPFVEQWSAGKFSIRTTTTQDVHIDGEYIGKEKDFEITVIPHSLDVIVLR